MELAKKNLLLTMENTLISSLKNHFCFEYSSFDRVVLRGYILGLFVPGQVINLLRNLGFKTYGNGVLRLLTDQLNSHIKKLQTALV